MVFKRETALLDRKARAGLTNRELANALGCSPGTVSSKLCGFCSFTYAERQTIEKTIAATEAAQAGITNNADLKGLTA